MADILTYAAGKVKTGADGMTDRERQAGHLMQLARKFSSEMHAADMAGIDESKKAAEGDIVRNTIDPNRVGNDEAYAATVLRNSLHKNTKDLHMGLQDPANPQNNVDPKEFEKSLQEESKKFYSSLKDNPFAESQAKIYTDYTVKNQPGVIAMQAKMYKDNAKSKQSIAAMTALTDLPPGEGDAYALNTAVLVQDMLPSDRYTTEERVKIVMESAVAAAHEGDRRLLDYATDYMDADVLSPVSVQRAENAFSADKTRKEAGAWRQAEADREQSADSGEYSYEQGLRELADPEMVKHFGEGSIKSWMQRGHASLMSQQTYKEGMDDFMAGNVLSAVDSTTRQKIFKDAKKNIYEKNNGDGLAAITDYAFFLSKQGEVDKETKAEMQGRFGRPVFTKEAFNDPNFQEAVVVYSALKDQLTNEQLVAQVGDLEMSNAELASQFIDDATAKYGAKDAMDKASDAYIMHMNTLKNQPELKLVKPDDRDVVAAVQEVLDGDVEGGDPNNDRWFGPDAENAIHTSQVSYEIRKQYGIEKGRGMSDASAMDIAKRKVAAKALYFGNELVWTEGVPLNTEFNMPEGSTVKDRDRAWEIFARKAGVDPSNAHFAKYGQYGYITDAEGEPIKEMGLFPLFQIGQGFEQATRDDREQKAARSMNDAINNVQIHNRHFENIIGMQSKGDDSVSFLKDGTTIENYKASDEESRSVMRKTYNEENKGMLSKLLEKSVGFIKGLKNQEFTAEDEARFRSVASDSTLAYLDGGPPGATITPAAIDNMREVDRRSAKSQADDRTRRGGLIPDEMAVEHSGGKAKTADMYSSRDDYENAAAKANESEQDDVARFRQEASVKEHEGFRGSPYEDSVGVKTIGYGRNLEAHPITKAEWKAIGGKRDLDKEPLTEGEADVLFQNDIKRARADVKSLYGKTYDKLSQARKDVVIDMAFNLGKGKLSKFTKFFQALRQGNYDKAAEEMRDSKWAEQVGPRADKLIEMMKKG